MKSKLNFLIGISLGRKIKTKWFVLANLLLAIVIVGVINIDSIITAFGGDFNEKQKILVMDKVGVYEIFKEQIEQGDLNLTSKEKEGSYEIIQYKKTLEEGKKELADKEKKAVLVVFEPSKENTMEVKVISKEYLDSIDGSVITNAINNTKVALALARSNIAPEELNQIYNPVTIDRIYLDEDKKSEEENMEMIVSTVFPILILPFFMLTIFLVQMIGAEVNDEKTTRGMEIIISNVSPATHFSAKVIAGNLFVLIQGALLLIFAGIGLGIRKLIGGNQIAGGIGSEVGNVLENVMNSGIGDKLIYIVPITIVLMILTFIAYSLLAGILASITTNIEDFQQLQTPIMIISLVGYYLAMMAGVFDGALFIKIFSFIPLISAILAPSLLMLGQIGLVEITISTILVIITNILLIKYGLKIYKVGILNYSSSGLWKKMFKALKN